MGFLEKGRPLTWPETLKHAAYIRQHGIIQFIHTYNRIKDRENDALKWGDEIEYHLIRLRHEKGDAVLELIAPEVLDTLEHQDETQRFLYASAWRPEYGSWMVEATPGVPYSNFIADLRAVERNMAMRRIRIASVLPPDVFPFSTVNFPLMGVGNHSTHPSRPAGGPFSRSAYVSDAVISPHPRFGALTANIRHRRGRKVDIQIPLFHDEKTSVTHVAEITDERLLAYGRPSSGSSEEAAAPDTESTRFYDDAQAHAERGESAGAVIATADDTDVGPAHLVKEGHIHADAMAFGMGCCCLQVTFQARNLRESRQLYDQLAVMSPLMLALTANAPIWRGHLADIDTRWDVIAASVDCRTPAESGEAVPEGVSSKPQWMASAHAANAAGHGTRSIPKSRYSSIDCYISDSARCLEEFNDVQLEYDTEAFAQLRAAGVDDRLARHVAHLFIRDPLVVFDGKVEEDDARSTAHFENLQSTNWRSMRWKPPPPLAPGESGTNAGIGWRVELRTMEAQLTDFENAAFTVFVVLLTRVLLFFDLNLYIPLSLVDENFNRARQREAASTQQFYFRSRITPLQAVCKPRGGAGETTEEPAWEEMRLADILLGKHKEADGSSSADCCAPCDGGRPTSSASTSCSSSMSTLTGTDFPGLIPLILVYLDINGCDEETRAVIDGYLHFIAGRASGTIPTGATWQRRFVQAHPDYAHDSVVPPTVVHDLLQRIQLMATGKAPADELLGPYAPPVFAFTEDVLTAPPAAEESAAAAATAAAAAASLSPTSSSATIASGDSESGCIPMLTSFLPEGESPALLAYAGALEGDGEAADGSQESPTTPRKHFRLRGSSFAESSFAAQVVDASCQCAAIQALVRVHAGRLTARWQLAAAAKAATTPPTASPPK